VGVGYTWKEVPTGGGLPRVKRRLDHQEGKVQGESHTGTCMRSGKRKGESKSRNWGTRKEKGASRGAKYARTEEGVRLGTMNGNW